MADIVAVVINVGTDLVATLALASLHQKRTRCARPSHQL